MCESVDLRKRDALTTRWGDFTDYVERRMGKPLYKKYGKKKQLRIVIDQCNKLAVKIEGVGEDVTMMELFMDWALSLSNDNRLGVRLIFVTSDGSAMPIIKSTVIKLPLCYECFFRGGKISEFCILLVIVEVCVSPDSMRAYMYVCV